MYSSYSDFEANKEKCRSCPVGNVYDRVVLSDGCKTNPVVMVVGEAPGSDEVSRGAPFVGKAGKLLRKHLNEHGFRKSNTLISNVIPCRPQDNKFPQDSELIRSCFNKWFRKEVEILKPRHMLLLGNQPLKFVLEQTGITRWRGQWMIFEMEDFKVWCLPTFHPSYVLRKQYMEDGENIQCHFRNDIIKLAMEAGLK